MNQTNNKTIAFALLVIAAGAIVYFVLGNKKAKAAEATLAPAVSDPKKSKPITVAETIATKSTSAVGTLSDAEIKKYATWIDRILQILVQSRNERKSKYAIPTEEALSNADALNKLSNANLRAVVNYWKGIRGSLKGLDMFVDNSGRLIELTFRLDELGLRK
jgi:DNA-directed RNA polymerase sigma subunit (sigma70/sigma32)